MTMPAPDANKDTAQPVTRLLANRNDVVEFVGALFRYADPDGYISLRAFSDIKEDAPPLFLEAMKVEAPNLIDRICARICDAASHPEPHVFCPPVCTFKTADSAKADDLAEGVALTVESDSRPKAALETLSALLGPPTVKVASGGIWKNPETGKTEAKLHLHWRLKEPTRDAAGHKMLREARGLAAVLVDADRSAKAIVHPLRWPGSWHRKASPTPARLQTNPDREIDLADALDKLRAACPLPDRDDRKTGELRGNVDDIEAALEAIPNNEDWNGWNHIGMTIWCATGGAGFNAFDRWSQRSSKYDADRTRARWENYSKSPPNRLGAGTLFWRAAQAEPGWRKPSLGPRRDDRRYGERPKSNDRDADQGASWDDPDESILDSRRGDLPEFPLNVLSEDLSAWAERNARGAGVTIGHVIVPLIGVASGLVGSARRVAASRSWTEPMTCWAAVVGPSASGKTPGINVTRRALNQIQSDQKQRIADMQRDHESKQGVAAACKAAWKAAVKEAAEAKPPKDPPPMPLEAMDPGKFIPPRLHISEGTIERFADLLQARPQGLVRLSDELSGMFLNMSRYNSGDERAFWLEAHVGDSHVLERMSRALSIPHLLIGVVGGMQPHKLAKSFERDHDGMYARFLFAWPPDAPCEDLSDEVAEIEPDTINMLKRLDDLAEIVDGALVTRMLPLSGDARDEFAQFRQFAHQHKQGFEGREREWLGKTPLHVLRLAGTLTLLHWAMRGGSEPQQVDAESMQAAITLVRDYFWPHARAALRQIGITDRHADARAALNWIRASGRPEVSREDIRREALSQRLDAGETEALLAAMERFGWLRRKPVAPQQGAGRHAHRWEVNPKLFSK